VSRMAPVMIKRQLDEELGGLESGLQSTRSGEKPIDISAAHFDRTMSSANPGRYGQQSDSLLTFDHLPEMFRVARVTSNSCSNIGSIWRTPCLARGFSSPAVGRTKKLMPTIVANTSPRQLSSDASPPSPGATTSTQEERTAKTEKRPPVAWPQRPGQDPSELTAHLKKTAIQYPYSVPRNSNGCEDLLHTLSLFYEPSLETCALTLFAKALKDDLVATLFPDTRNNRFMNHRLATNIRVHHNRHVIIQGGQWAKQVQKWLLARGF
ncbi:17379_t:CDS:2, partial [Acaulospora colombiana]